MKRFYEDIFYNEDKPEELKEYILKEDLEEYIKMLNDMSIEEFNTYMKRHILNAEKK